VEVFRGNTKDETTVLDKINEIEESYGINVSSTGGKDSGEERGGDGKAEGRFRREERIGNEAGDEINEEVDRATVTGMFNLTDIFEEIINGFNDSPFAKE